MTLSLRSVVCFAFLVFAFMVAPATGSEQAFIVLKSKEFADTETTISLLESFGARVGHVIPPRALIASVPAEIESLVLLIPNVESLSRGPVSPEDGDLEIGAGAWNHLIMPRAESSDPMGEPLIGDALPPPAPEGPIGPPMLGAAPGTYQTSEFMIGKVAVGIILPESNGGSENWSTARQNQVYNEIVAGLNWWVNRGGAAARLTFYYDLKFSVPTQYEPITMSGWSDEEIWVTDIFQNMGYTSGTRMTRAYNYINDLRNTLRTDWCYAFIVVDSLNDPDGKFTSGYFAWAYLGGPYVIMTYDNDGWGIDNMDRVASHETGHIFLAGDEYCQQGYACCDFGYYGYLNVYNGNCEKNNPSSVPCRMRYNEDALCQYTRGQVGWRDTDSDGLPDPIDNVVSNTLNTPTAPTGPGPVVLTGSATDIPYDSPTRTDVTINKISVVRYRVNGGPWNDASASDGAFDEDSETYTFTTNLWIGSHLVETQAFSTSGNSSSIASRNVTVPTPDYFILPTSFEWIDPSSHSALSLTGNGVSPALDLPFTFKFYGASYNQIYVGANGLAGFVNSGLSAYNNVNIPNTATPNAALYPYWDDLDPSSGGSVRIGVVGTAPNRKVVISWVNVPRYGYSLPFTFQAILCETTYDIIFQYLQVQPDDMIGGAGRSATVGIENTDGTAAARYSYNGTTLLANSQALLFTNRMPVSTVKAKPDNTEVVIRGDIVTCVGSDWFYIEDPQRTSGIRVQKAGHGLTLGTKVIVAGTVLTNSDGERYILASGVTSEGSGSVKPVALNGRSIGGGNWQYDPVTGKGQRGISGGIGLCNIGLLVTTFGKITEFDPANPITWFRINDGSKVSVKCIVPSGVVVDRGWRYVLVTGVCSCENVSGNLRPLLRVRQQQDIVVVQ